MLNLSGDVRDLFRHIVDIESVSGHEGPLADEIFTALSACPHLQVTRLGNVVVARTAFGCTSRVVVAGHLDTVPVAGNLPGHVDTVDGRAVLSGRGTCDMKGGVAVQLSLAHAITDAPYDITWIFYDNEEVESSKNGLGRLADARPDLLQADLAILMEPSDGLLEAGCQGTLRIRVATHGIAAHSARSWLGHNAIHDMVGVLSVLAADHAATVVVDGLAYREGLNAVGISGGIAGNIVPDRCDLTVNYRFAPDKSVEQAVAAVQAVFAGYEVAVTDAAPAARPQLSSDLMASFVSAVGQPVRPKYGWTDVARFSHLGIPAINYGPGDPNLCHTDQEFAFLDDVVRCRQVLRDWLTGVSQ